MTREHRFSLGFVATVVIPAMLLGVAQREAKTSLSVIPTSVMIQRVGPRVEDIEDLESSRVVTRKLGRCAHCLHGE